MATYAAPSSVSTKRLWTGRVLSALGALFLLFDGVIHILKITPVVEAFAQLGYPLGTAGALGVIEIICVALYLLPRTSVLGAILLTGYLGGAIATQVRVGAPLFSTTLFPIYVALFVWGGLYLRDEAVRALIPLRRQA
ncbi:MAG TPA: DoxX family protein [Gemmatimonadaceae bacterium]|nr:DoxX family protein [Gemmatimonadaceae bacterium]